jgi:DNA-binding transcriptional regulator YdaS (Cro superfamily)
VTQRSTPSVREHIAQAIALAGGQVKLAALLGVTQQAVSGWLRGVRWMPARHAEVIQEWLCVPAAGLINPKKVLG